MVVQLAIFILGLFSQASAAESPIGTITPYFDFYYSYNFNVPFPPNPTSGATVVSARQPNGNNPLRFYDQYHNQFSLAVLEFAIQKKFDVAEFVVDLDFGQSADINARIGSGSLQVVDESTKHIGQAFVRWIPVEYPSLVVETGKFATHMGLEGWKAKDNWQYSRTMMFSFGLPIWHSGIRAFYAMSPEWTLGLAVYNGWNNFYDSNASKSVGARLQWNASDTLSVTYNFLGGAEQDNESSNQRNVHEFNAVLLSGAWSFGFESIYGSEQNVVTASIPRDMVTWSGYGLQSRWQVNDQLEINPRIEFYSDNHGYTLGNGEQKVWSASITEVHHLSGGIEPRIEARYDKTTADGTFSRQNAAVNDQFSLTFALLFTPGTF